MDTCAGPHEGDDGGKCRRDAHGRVWDRAKVTGSQIDRHKFVLHCGWLSTTDEGIFYTATLGLIHRVGSIAFVSRTSVAWNKHKTTLPLNQIRETTIERVLSSTTGTR